MISAYGRCQSSAESVVSSIDASFQESFLDNVVQGNVSVETDAARRQHRHYLELDNLNELMREAYGS